MTGDNFIALAGKLAAMSKPGADESAIRTSIGRAYYGAFHLVLSLLEELAIPQIGKSHDLHKQLEQSGETNARQAARLLENLYEDRRKADYRLDLQQFSTIERAEDCVARAHRIRSLLDVCRQEPARTVIRTNLMMWKAKTGRQ